MRTSIEKFPDLDPMNTFALSYIYTTVVLAAATNILVLVVVAVVLLPEFSLV